MENYKFEVIPMENGRKSQLRRPLFRQIMVCIGAWSVLYFTPGLLVGVPPVFISRTRREANSTEVVSAEMESWLYSSFNYGTIPWIFILPMISHYYGRKVVFYILGLNIVASCIILYFSNSVMHVLLTEIMVGMSLAAHVSVSVMIIAEYTSPQYRGVFITLKSAIFYWGIWVGNTMGTYSHWRNIGILGMVSSIFCGTIIFWPESPYWLASKRKFEKCAASHRWLKGVDSESEKELQMLIQSCKHLQRSERFSLRSIWRTLKTSIREKEVYKPVLLSLTLVMLYSSSGKLVFTMYILTIINKVTKSDSTSYLAMLLLDGVTVVGMYIGCILAKFLRRRTILLSCSSVAVTFLCTISLYLYLSKLDIIGTNKIVLIFLLTGYSIFISVGPMIMVTAIYGEIMPRKFGHETSIIVALFWVIYDTLLLKFAPDIFIALGFHGSFLLYAIISSVLIIVLYKHLPETKDKTLQEISDWFKGHSVNPSNGE